MDLVSSEAVAVTDALLLVAALLVDAAALVVVVVLDFLDDSFSDAVLTLAPVEDKAGAEPVEDAVLFFFFASLARALSPAFFALFWHLVTILDWHVLSVVLHLDSFFLFFFMHFLYAL